MKTLVNKVQLIGRLGMDPVTSTIGKNKNMARFSIATDASYKNAKGEKIQDAHWHAIVAWGSSATFAGKCLKKGQEVAIEGRLVNRSYDDADGQKRYITEVHAASFLMLGSKAKAA
jgi:single-strand DNA-binding protein